MSLFVSPNHRKQIQKRLNKALQARFPELKVDLWTQPHPARYPCSSLEILVSFQIQFPQDVSDEYPQQGQFFQSSSIAIIPAPNCLEYTVLEQLRPCVAEWDKKFQASLATLGMTNYSDKHPWNRTSEFSYVLLVCPPPLTQEAENHAFYYGHWMSPAQRERFREEAGREPFSDEAWIIDRYSAIRVFRSALLEAIPNCGDSV